MHERKIPDLPSHYRSKEILTRKVKKLNNSYNEAMTKTSVS